MSNAGKDGNFVSTLIGVSNADLATPIRVAVDPDTNELLVQAAVSLSGDSVPVSGASTAVSVQVVDGSGDQITSFGGGTQYTEGDTDATITGTAMMWEDGSETIRSVSATKPLPVDLGTNNDVTVTGTVDLGATDNAVLDTIDAVLDTINAKLVTGTDIGDVTINNASGASAVNIQDGGNTITVDGTVTANLSATDNTVLDNIEAGIDELKTGVVLQAGTNGIGKLTANSGVDIGDVTLTAGSAAIGKLAANSGVDIGDVTLTAGTNSIGKILPPDTDVTAHTNYARKYYTSATPTDGIIWSPAAGKRWHVTTMYINVSAASTITLEDDKAGGDDPVWKGEIAANSGVVLQFPEKYPMASGEDAADLTVTSTAGTVYITCVGYEV